MPMVTKETMLSLSKFRKRLEDSFNFVFDIIASREILAFRLRNLDRENFANFSKRLHKHLIYFMSERLDYLKMRDCR